MIARSPWSRTREQYRSALFAVAAARLFAVSDEVDAQHGHDHEPGRSRQHQAGHSHGHSHGHDHADLPLTRRVRRILDLLAIVLAVATVVGMLMVTLDRDAPPTSSSFASEVHRADVVEVEVGACGEFADGSSCRVVTFELTQGPHTGETRQEIYGLDQPPSLRVHVGDRVMLDYYPDSTPPDDYRYTGDRQRQSTLWILAGLFVVAVVGLGRLRGLAALAGLALSLVVILQFTLPNLLGGADPVLVAVLTASAVAYLALYLAHGVNPLTTVALLGTIGALALIIALSAVFTAMCNFTGLADDSSVILGNLLSSAGRPIDLVGLILAGTVIGALGALDDMTVTQASAVAELHAANPSLGAVELYRRALRIGRDHISSTVNTLALAYVGAALPTLLIFTSSSQSLGTIANRETIAVEIVRTLIGSLGLVAAVPITTALAAFVVRAGIHETGRHTVSE